MTKAKGSYMMTAVAADFTGHGKVDLAILGFDTNVNTVDVQVLIGNGDGTFQVGPVSVPLGYNPGFGTYAFSTAVGDVNGDHHADLVFGKPFGFSVMLGNGDGSFAAPVDYLPNTFTPASLKITAIVNAPAGSPQ